jgi:hypothetical protein
MEDTFFVKLIAPTGDATYVKHIPCVLGSESSLRVKLNALKEGPSQSINLKIDRDALALQSGQLSLAAFKTLEEHKVNQKLVVSKCKSIATFHLVIEYDFDQETFGVVAIDNFSLNGQTVTS